jgi:RNA polymerase sigma-70 factor (ECF subfamily)
VSIPVTQTDDVPSGERVLVGDPPEVRALVAAARTGDRAAFDDLVSLYHRAVFRTALAALQRREDADDATQDAFVLAWRKIAGFRGESSFKTWMLTIVWRQALDRRRSRARWWQRSSGGQAGPAAADNGASGNDAMDRLVSLEADPERQTEARHRVRQVRAAIEALTPKLRDTLLLAASGEYGYDEISAMLGVPVGTVKWRVAEARRIVSAKCAVRSVQSVGRGL